MPEAHPDNGGIQVFSRTQSAEQIQKALESRGFEGFELETIATAPIAVEEPPAVPVVETPPVVVETLKPPRPGKSERQLARANKQIDEMREESIRRDREFAELRGMVAGLSARPAPVVEPPVVAEPPVVVAPPVAPPVKDRPKREDFYESEDPDSAYDAAARRYDYNVFRAEEKAEEERQAREAAARTAELESRKIADSKKTVEERDRERWNAALTEAKTAYADYDTVMETKHFDKDQKPLAIISGPMRYIIDRSKMGPKLLYWIGSHPEEANKLAVKTTITDINDAWAIQEAMSEVNTEFKRIEQEIIAATPAPAPAAPKAGTPPDDDDDDEDPDVDPNIPVVSDSSVGKKVAQPAHPGAVDTQVVPPVSNAPVAPAGVKSEPVNRVGSRQTNVNRSLLDTPPEVIRQTTPDEYRKKRILEGSTAARG